MIQVKNIHKEFGSVVAVDDVSFEAHGGSITALLGPNGAGKTTTLRLITAVMKPDRGQVRVDGFDTVKDAATARSKLGLLSDNRGLYQRLTSRENVRYFGRLHGLDGAALEARVDRVMNLLDMKEIADRRVEGFSLGQKLKVAIARTLVHDPPNVLLDEPTAGLDVMTTRAMRDVILRLRDEGKCVVLSSHVMQEVARLADRIVVVARGRVRVVATPDELRAQTGCESLEDAFVAALGTDEGVMA
ncbi:MAG TPA: ATP-binding cassette domain-containing protein [Polyangiaceae bacterium]